MLFRSSQRLESMQVQAEIVASKTKDLLGTYSLQSKALLMQTWNSGKVEQFKTNVLQLINFLVETSKNFKTQIINIADPKHIWILLTQKIGGKWTTKETTLACAGFLVGSIVGVAIGLAIRKKEPIIRYMQAIWIEHYQGPESVTVVENAEAPYECGDYDVLVNVKAGSVQIIDSQICWGYGKTLRYILRRILKEKELPVILGRDCTGIITDLGKNVKRLDVGDEVWVTVPFWSKGTLCQTILVSENRVARKPKNVGFEGSCSIPYAGSLALSALSDASIDCITVKSKKFLIQGGCTPVGCILIQLLKHWKAHVVTTCYTRALPIAKALGAHEIITIDDIDEEKNYTVDNHELFKQLEGRGELFDVIITTQCIGLDNFKQFCKEDGQLISTFPKTLPSDEFGFLNKSFLAQHIEFKYLIKDIIGSSLEIYDEAHLCYSTLDKLTELVEDGILQTVVDRVFQPKDIELALNYIQSPASIGSTVITFR